MNYRRMASILTMGLLLVSFTAVFAQDITPTPDTHNAHHPAATPAPDSTGGMGMMQPMTDMMDSMMDMDMSPEMRDMMNQMRGMMDMMMGMMHGGDMAGMPMPTPEGDMSGMDMSGQDSGSMAMEMDTGYSVDNLAPLALAYFDGGKVYFVHPEASDAGVAEVLTKMMGTDVLTVPSLAHIPEELLGNVYVFTNGVTGMGPLGFQPDVFDSIPGSETYTPLRAVSLVTWKDGVSARELTSVSEILAAKDTGDLTIERPGVVVNMPILVWPDGQR